MGRAGANGGILDKIGWTASESTVTVWQGVIQNWGVAVPDGAKVTVTGLPTGLKFAQDKTTKLWTLAGKIWDGTAVKGTAYPLAKLTKTEGNYLSPVLLTDKAKNAVYLELSDDGSYCRVLENGVKVAIGKDGATPWTDFFSAADLKNKTFEGLVNANKLIVLADGDTESSPQQEVELPLTTKEQKAKAAANGLAKITLTDEDGWKWVCEMLPIDSETIPQFRGIATGTRKDPVTKKNVTQYAPVWSK